MSAGEKKLHFGVAEQIMLNELQGLMHMAFYGMPGNLKPDGNFFMAQSLFAA